MAALFSACDTFMTLTYNQNHSPASIAAALRAAAHLPCRLSPLVLMSDPVRCPDPVAACRKLPKRSVIIYRHFGAPDRLKIADDLRQACFEHDVQLLIGADVELARVCGADGVHLPQRQAAAARATRRRYPDWIISCAAHSANAVDAAQEVDAVILSAVFPSQSPSAGAPLGVAAFAKIAKGSRVPVFALGGISQLTAPKLLGSGASGLAGVSGITA